MTVSIKTLGLPLAALLALGVPLSAQIANPATAQCTLPPAPGQATIDSTFDSLVMQNGPGWTGGDGSYSLALPGGDELWLWSDSYIGTVNPSTRLRSSDLFQAHNALTVWDPSTGSFTTVGYPPSTSSYFAPKNKKDWFWVGGSILVEPSPGEYEIEVMLTEWTGSFQFVGNSVATLSYPSFSILSIDSVQLPDTTIEWGQKILQSGSYYYVYGLKDPGNDNKLPYVARIKSLSALMQPAQWQYWNANTSSWVSGQSNATPLSGVPAITGEYSVEQLTSSMGPFYLMVGMDPQDPAYPDWKYVTTYYSCTPQGPWTTRTVVYTTPESGAPGCSVGTLFTYNPKAHIEFTDDTGVLVSYNVNANNSKDLICANDYIPRFIRVPITGVAATGVP